MFSFFYLFTPALSKWPSCPTPLFPEWVPILHRALPNIIIGLTYTPRVTCFLSKGREEERRRGVNRIRPVRIPWWDPATQSPLPMCSLFCPTGGASWWGFKRGGGLSVFDTFGVQRSNGANIREAFPVEQRFGKCQRLLWLLGEHCSWIRTFRQPPECARACLTWSAMRNAFNRLPVSGRREKTSSPTSLSPGFNAVF